MRNRLFGRTAAKAVITVSAICTASCYQPLVRNDFTLRPTGPRSVVDEDARDAEAIAATLAERHGLISEDMSDGAMLVTYSALIERGPNAHFPRYLALSVSRFANGTLHISLSEYATRSWSMKGDSLRRDLHDSLTAHFPSIITVPSER